MSEIEEGNEPQEDVLGLLDELGKEPEPNDPTPKVDDEPGGTLDDDGVLDDPASEEIPADDEELDEETAAELGLIEKPAPKAKEEEKPKVETAPAVETKTTDDKPAPTPIDELTEFHKTAAAELKAIQDESALIQNYFAGKQNIKGYPPCDAPEGIAEDVRAYLEQRLRDNSAAYAVRNFALNQQRDAIVKRVEEHNKGLESQKAHGAKLEYLDYREEILDRFIKDYKHLGVFRDKLAVNFDKAFRSGKLSTDMAMKDFVDVVAGSVIREEVKKRREADPKRKPNAAHVSGVIEDEARTPKGASAPTNGANVTGLVGANGISQKTMDRIYAAYEREFNMDWRSLECADDVTDLVGWYKGKFAGKK